MSFSSKIKRAEGLITAFIVIWAIVMIYHVVFVRPINLGFLFAISVIFGFGLYFTKMLRDKLVRDLENYSFAEEDEQKISGAACDGIPPAEFRALYPNADKDEVDEEDADSEFERFLDSDEEDDADEDEFEQFIDSVEEDEEDRPMTSIEKAREVKDLTASGVNLGGEGPPGYKGASHSGQPGSSVDDIHYQNAVEFFGEPGCMVDWDDETCFLLSQKLAHVQRFMDMSVYKGNDSQRAHYILNEVKSISEELDEFYTQLKLDIVGPDYDDMGDVEGY